MKLFRRDYQAERNFMRKSYIRWRGQAWFLWTYGIIVTLLCLLFSLYATILVDFIIRVVGSYVTAFGSLVQTGVTQWPDTQSVIDMAFAVFNPIAMLTILWRLSLVTSIFLLLLFAWLEKRYVVTRIYQWFQLYRDQTRNTNRFAEVSEVDRTYKLIPDRNKHYKGTPGQPVLHTNGYTFEFFLIHPLLWGLQWLKRIAGMNRLEFKGLYGKLRPHLVARFPNLVDPLVKGGFDGFYWIDTSNTHCKTTGMTRSSKDQMRGYTLIDIIRRAEIKWNILDTDAKNEDAKMSYKALRIAGYDVKLLNIMNPSESDSWNPLEVAIDYAFDGDWDSANTELRKVVQVIGGQGNRPEQQKDIWDGAAESTIQAIMLIVLNIAVEHQDRSLVTIANVLQFINDMTKFTDKKGDGLTKYLINVGKLPRTPARNMITLNAGEYLSATGDTKSSISFSVTNRLNLFASESITRLTSFNSINLTDLGFPRMLKLKFNHDYQGAHVGIVITAAGSQKVIEEDKLTITQSGTLLYPIHHHLPKNWEITLTFNEKGNTSPLRKQALVIKGKIVQRKLLNGKVKRDDFSKKPVIQCLVDKVTPVNAKATPEVKLRYSERPMAVFIITPQSNDDFSSLASLFISQVFSVNTDIAANITRRKMDSWILYKLNEFSMFPRIPGFTNILTRGLTYGHIVDLYIQTLTQPRLHYSEMETNDINGNTGNWFHILTNDVATNEALSKQLGEIEVQTESVNSQIGHDRQDRGNRQIQVNKVRLLDANEIGQLNEREMLTIRTIKRRDKKGHDVRPLPIFSTGAYRMPFAYELLGKQFSLDYYTADLNIKSAYNQLSYDELYADFTPYYSELEQAVSMSDLMDGEVADYVMPNQDISDLDAQVLQNVIDNHSTKYKEPASDSFEDDSDQQNADEQRYLNWKKGIKKDNPFLTEEQIDDSDLRTRMETALRRMMPRSTPTPEQAVAYPFLMDGEFFKIPANNNYGKLLRLLNNEPEKLWVLYRTLIEATQGDFDND
ncbi:type IV secretory system conjugative DNA transfer family protein [Leuconostoc citreum]|uniref:type IV secretory system conjugative DNA transfer family protein n=1 Tax=Leuconostoc citreum TaxID=33964 RepID=UPI00200A9191|nr:type IV secretory system conjugative DNA transfer family protein [Leuconostoc citreum]MCK8605679.1 type IV secretory system conjugative DNA transfer family protein [Leuconostoc citreum]